MATITTVAIIGANGNLGQAVLPSISASFEVTVITREESTSVFPPNVKVVKTKYTEDKLAKALHGQDAVLCLIDAGALQAENLIINAAASAGVKWFIPSEFGHNTTDTRVSKVLPLLEGKIKVVSQLRDKEHQGMQWTGLITGLFFDWGLARGVLGFDIAKKKAQIWDGGNTKFLATNLEDIVAALMTLLRDAHVREKAKNRYVYISSFATTQNETLRELEKFSGSEFAVTHVKSDVLKQKALADLTLSQDGLSQWYKEAEQGKKLLLLTPQESLEETVKRVVAEAGGSQKSSI
ncbi:nmrA-like family protein [Beauveria brongniartii RCEF 3172]|uniref:NmrA-like family protein n=1 Tax=Beauveria brongniartii RCEF 3172 TaxID=1081107 RepID=A0A166XN66_9HYPO|nr:nmrA-like family protein [Beauveria brongniartii RCEF 3172]